MPAPAWVVDTWPDSAMNIAVRSKDKRGSKSINETRFYVTSLQTGAYDLSWHVRDRESIENSCRWPRDTQLDEDAHRYVERNGVQVMATLRSLVMNALRLGVFWSITYGLDALAHDIKVLLELLGCQEPRRGLSSA